jgi:FtsZ-binding cell division protein ZapB
MEEIEKLKKENEKLRKENESFKVHNEKLLGENRLLTLQLLDINSNCNKILNMLG